MTKEQEEEILRLFSDGVRQAQISIRVGPSPSSICQLLKRRGISPQPWPLLRTSPTRKTCSSCKTEKSAAEFRTKKSSSDGLSPACRACQSEKERRAWPTRYANPEYKLKRWESDLRRCFGMSLSEYDALLASQDKSCKICKVHISSTRWLCLDHDHKTGAVRGILCIKCNQLMGRLDSVPDWADAVARYLHFPPV